MTTRARANLTGQQVQALTDLLVRKLDALVIETQPEVAARLLELVGDDRAGLSDFAKVIRTDPALAGRMLRMANSAYFAQREPVTTLERACVLLGLSRIRALALGFYLSRSIAPGGDERSLRLMWGQALLRACLSAKLAELKQPSLYAEAFLVGLLMDAGLPLVRALIGPEAYDRACPPGLPPSRAFHVESHTFSYTHVDVARALVVRWRIPEVLAWPIMWHHSAPKDLRAPGSVHLLHRIAFFVGSMHVRHEPPSAMALPLPGLGQKLLGTPVKQLGKAFAGACAEYVAVRELFGPIAEGITDVEALARRVQVALNSILERSIEEQLASPASAQELLAPGRFAFSHGHVEVALDQHNDGFAVACLMDEHGQRQALHRFPIGAMRSDDLLDALGIEREELPGEQRQGLDDYLRAMAA